MAADQRRKRLHGASIIGSSSREQHKVKRKNLGLPHNESNTKAHISLQWDGNQKRVVAKREQIGVSRRDLRPFNGSVPEHHNTIADVFAIPQEIFELEDLTEVLSHEVWQSHLSENERNSLMQLLPRGPEPQQVMQALFAGDNFHFGNPFLKWGASLCSGGLHPDAIHHREQCLKAEKKAYYSSLQKYHSDMVGYLVKLKGRWESGKDLEKETVQKLWRSRNGVEKRITSHGNESRFPDPEEDLTATSESCSWAADDKACSSDNQNTSGTKGAELIKRLSEKGFMKDKGRNPLTASDNVLNVGARPRNGDKIHKRNIHCSDGAKYMSYFKISKKQHELVKNMKQSGKSIQSRSLNRVLGNLDSFHVQPYEVFVEEEQKKLHQHWLQLATEVLPVAFDNWRGRQLQRSLVINSLAQEVKDYKKSLIKDKNNVNLESMLEDEKENKLISNVSTVEDDEELVPGSPWNQESVPYLPGNQQSVPGSPLNEESVPGLPQNEESVPGSPQNEESVPGSPQNEESIPGSPQNQESVSVSPPNQESIPGSPQSQESIPGSPQSQESIPCSPQNQESLPGSPQNQSLQHISSPSGDHEIDPIDMDAEDNHIMSKSDSAPADKSGYSGDLNTADDVICRGVPLTSGEDIWPAVNVSHSFYDSTASHEFTSASGLPLEHSQVNEHHRTHMIDLESDLQVEESGKDFLQRQSGDCSFSSYPNQDRNELLQSLFKSQGMLYHQEQKQTGLEFQPQVNLSMENGQFPGHFQEQPQQSMPLELEQKRQNEVYMQRNISGNMYSDGGRYLIPRQEHLTPVNVQDLPVNTICMPAPLPSGLNGGGLLSQNWFPGEHQVHGGWAGSDGASVRSQSIGSGSGADQSLFHVLSHCNQLRSSGPYDSVGSTEQFIPSRNYGMVVGGNVTPRISNVLPQASHPLDFLSGREAATSVMPDDMGWMSLSHQNSVLHDPMGKPYLRSWNQ
nr:uncharacterized protein LOC112020991 [Quercus suber]